MVGSGKDEQHGWLDIEQPTSRATLLIIELPADPAKTVPSANLAEIELPTWRAELIVTLSSWDPA